MSEARQLLQRFIKMYRENSKISTLMDLVKDVDDYLAKPLPEPAAWRLTNTSFRRYRFEYHESREQAVSRQNDFNRSVDDGGLYDLTSLYAEPPASKPLPDPVPGVAMLDGQPVLVKIGTEDQYEGRLYSVPQVRRHYTSASPVVKRIALGLDDIVPKYWSPGKVKAKPHSYIVEIEEMIAVILNDEEPPAMNNLDRDYNGTLEAIKPYIKQDELAEAIDKHQPARKPLTDARITEIANSVQSNIADGIYTYLNEFAKAIEREIDNGIKEQE